MAEGQGFGRVRLTSKEREVVALLASGLTNQEIGRLTCMSQHTVAAYVRAAIARNLVRNRTELVARCYVDGVLSPHEWPPTVG